MTKYTITYERKVQIRPYEMLTIGLAEEFDSERNRKPEAFDFVKTRVDMWIAAERARL